MRRAQRNDPIYFIAEYEDGSKAYFGIDRAILQNDDQIALAIANQRQRLAARSGFDHISPPQCLGGSLH